MVSLHASPERRVELHRSFIAAAAARGVAHVVYLSFVNAGPAATFLHARSHGATEQMLRGVWPGVHLHPQRHVRGPHPGLVRRRGVARSAAGDGRSSFSYRPELAEAIAVALTEPGHEGKTYDVTAEPVGLAELASVASEVTGREYTYEPLPRDEWEARRRTRGLPEWEIEAGLTSFDAQIVGELDVVSDDFRALTGRAPLTVPELIARLADELPLARSG